MTAQIIAGLRVDDYGEGNVNESIDYISLRNTMNVTDSNLVTHLRTLEDMIAAATRSGETPKTI